MHSPLMRSVRRGFTMIELLLVVAIIGVMVAIVGPKFRLNEATEVQIAGMQLVQDLELARTRALSTRSEVRFVFDAQSAPGSYVGYLDHNSDGAIGESDAERNALRGFGRRELAGRVDYGRGAADPLPTDGNGNPITFDDDRVRFNTRGITEPLGTAGVVYITSTEDKNRVSAVALSGSGAVRLWVWRNGAWE